MPANLVQDVANQAMDQIGWSHEFGDLEEGSFEGRIVLRAYSQCLRQLLRSVHWNFARSQQPMVLLADASGNTPGVGTVVPRPWVYEYALPENCMKVRFVPWSFGGVASGVPQGNIQPSNPSAPIVSGLGTPVAGVGLRPARFLETMDPNYPPPAGTQTWDVQGVSPQGRTVILTNVKNALLVYTALMNYPSNWDPQFRAAFVAFLAGEVALPLWAKKDRKFGMQMRVQQLAVAKEKIMQARVTDGNENFTNVDVIPDYIRFRHAGGRGYGYNGFGGDMVGGTGGTFFGGCDDCCGAGNTSAY